MSIDLTGITNKNEYYTNHYFSTVFEENTSTTISNWNAAARDSEEIKTPWSLLRQNARQYYTAHDKFVRSSVNLQVLANIKALAGSYLKSFDDVILKMKTCLIHSFLEDSSYSASSTNSREIEKLIDNFTI